MTKEQFLERLRRSPRTWSLVVDILLRNESHCPLTQIAEDHGIEVKDCSEWVYAGIFLEMDGKLSMQIMVCSDRILASPLYSEEFREELLEACGLTQPIVSK